MEWVCYDTIKILKNNFIIKMYMSNRINNAINLIGTEIINTLQDISKPIIENIGCTKEIYKRSKVKYYYNENADYIFICIENYLLFQNKIAVLKYVEDI